MLSKSHVYFIKIPGENSVGAGVPNNVSFSEEMHGLEPMDNCMSYFEVDRVVRLRGGIPCALRPLH